MTLQAMVNRDAPGLARRLWVWHAFVGALIAPYLAVIGLTGALLTLRPVVPARNSRARETTALRPTRGPNVWEYTLRLHQALALGLPGRFIVELSTGWAMLLIFSGVRMWARRRWRVADMFRARRASTRYLFLRSIHVLPGVILAPLILVLCATGLYFSPVTGDWVWILYSGVSGCTTSKSAFDLDSVVYSVHTGSIFGAPSILLAACGGIALAYLAITGFCMRLQRRSRSGQGFPKQGILAFWPLTSAIPMLAVTMVCPLVSLSVASAWSMSALVKRRQS